jgi:acetyl-CoA carboxylase biotin carboxyl carrier protein
VELTNEDVERILKLVENSEFAHIEIEWKGLSLKLSRTSEGSGSGPAPSHAASPAAAVAPAPASIQLAPAASVPQALVTPVAAVAPAAVAPARPATAASAGFTVKAPLMGTFYRSPEPGKPPFVEIGARVQMGDTLCLLEVMKMFNSIGAEVSGRVVEACVAEGQLVDYDAPLFVIEQDSP